MKKAILLSVVLALALLSCGPSKQAGSKGGNGRLLDENTFLLTEVSDDETYGYTQENPVKVGGVKDSEGPKNQRRFLNALAGPAGEKVTYFRKGSCCMFKTKNGLMGSGLLDRYEVTIEGQEKPVIIYINLYDFGKMKAPKGFTIKK